MSSQIITNIKQLVNVREHTHLLRGEELAELPIIENAYLIIEDGIIAEYGEMLNCKYSHLSTVNCQLSTVLPCWCDSHTHLVFAGSRENEFVDKIKGLSYAEIAAKGGGILNSAKKMHNTSEDELFIQAWKRLEEVAKL
ncbi:MAG: imidazolonepropionase, partial [Ginsengibacter sp.]